MIFDKLWRLQRRRKKLAHLYEPDIDKAKKENRHEDYESLVSEYQTEGNLLNDDLQIAQTFRLIRDAENHGIPTPPYSDQTAWEVGYHPGKTYLSVAAQHEIRKAIREERAARRDYWVGWIKDVAAPLVSVIGALMGIIALVHSLWKSK
jgi:hypothetical protein